MNSFIKNKYLITGGHGFLGKHVVDNLIKKGVPLENISIPNSSKIDLRNINDVKKIILKNQIVIHLAANVGGLGKGLNKSADYFYDNSMMALNMIKIGNDKGIKKFIGVGSILQYPENTPFPFKEKSLFDTFPSGVTAPYALGKNVMLYASNFFYEQYKFDNVNVILPNLYGPGDDFNPASSHVIASLIYKINKAKINNDNSIKVWGNGNVFKEFMFVKDAAEAILLLTKTNCKTKIFNIGSGVSTSIKSLTYLIAKLMNFYGKIEWEKQEQEGTRKNQLDSELAIKELDFKTKTSLELGIQDTIRWYYNNMGHIIEVAEGKK
jgi:GDP-L-fucose synthase